MATTEIINREMLELKELLDRATGSIRENLGHGVLLRVSELKKVRTSMVKAGLDVDQVDRDMDTLRGTKEQKGLFFVLGVTDDGQAKKKKAEADVGEQRSIDDERDYATHSMNTDQVREFVADIVSDEGLAVAAKIARLNALEDGEREREGGSRESILKVIRSARTPLAKKVQNLALVGK